MQEPETDFGQHCMESSFGTSVLSKRALNTFSAIVEDFTTLLMSSMIAVSWSEICTYISLFREAATAKKPYTGYAEHRKSPCL
jgi:hypothetical protein